LGQQSFCEMFCGECGAKVENVNAKFCATCGHAVTRLSVAPEQKQEEVIIPATGSVGAEGTCIACGGVFPPGEQQSHLIQAFGAKWHKTCFNCCLCGQRVFTIGKFYEKDGKPLCAPCYKKNDQPLCFGCHNKIDSFVLIQAFNHTWHQKCLVCSVCKKESGSAGMFEDEGKLFHLTCYK